MAEIKVFYAGRIYKVSWTHNKLVVQRDTGKIRRFRSLTQAYKQYPNLQQILTKHRSSLQKL